MTLVRMSCNQPIDMNLHLLKNVKSMVNNLDEVNEAYADRIKYKTATGNIPNTVMTDHTLHICRCESFCQCKDKHM